MSMVRLYIDSYYNFEVQISSAGVQVEVNCCSLMLRHCHAFGDIFLIYLS